MKTVWVSATNNNPQHVHLWQWNPATLWPELEGDARRVELSCDPWKEFDYESLIVCEAHSIIVRNRIEVALMFQNFMREWLASREIDPPPRPRDPYATIEWEAP